MNKETKDLQNRSIKIATVIATFNNEKTAADVIQGVKKSLSDIIVVNDGSTDNSADILKQIHDIKIITFPENRGKGYALRTGFEEADRLGFTHVITLDSDGQHLPEEIPIFIKKIYEQPDTIWIGKRVLPFEKGGAPPKRSSLGRKFGNFWYRFNTGIKLHDTQCGFRAYPLKKILSLKCRGTRFEYEQDILIKAAWNGIHIKEIPIRQYYLPTEKTVSHFRPFRDFMRISSINSRAAIIRIFLPVTALEVPGATWQEKIVALVKHEIKANTTPKKAAASISVGVFMGIFPIHGFQVVTLMGLSLLLHLNRPLAFLGVCISSPPFLPFLIVAAVAIGRLVIHRNIVIPASQKAIELIARGAIEFVVGSIILSVIAGITAYIITYPMLKKLTKTSFFKRQEKFQ